MTKNRASDAGTPKRTMTGAMTFAAALVLSFAGMSAAHACKTGVTVHSEWPHKIQLRWVGTKVGDGGVADNPNCCFDRFYIEPGGSHSFSLKTLRKKSVPFYVVLTSEGDYRTGEFSTFDRRKRFYCEPRLCREGHVVIVK